MLATVDLMDDVLPDDRLRYFMGIGDPRGIVDVVARGVDVFDCVLPSRMARTGTALLRDGRRLNLANAAFTRDLGPLDAGCDCPCCRTFSRAYLRHLVKRRELLAHELLTLHNIRSLVRLCLDARAAICAGRFSDIAASVAGR
jgi:queuine tRNA-ribosyltransferase